MKIICEVSVHNRLAPHVKPRSQQSTLALGYSTPANKTPDNLFLMHFSSTNKTGTRYTLKRNLEKVFSRFLGDGKATFSMKQPPHDLHVKCEPLQLKAFLAAMKVALAGKENMDKLGLSTLAVTGVAKKALPVTKMTITRPSDYPLKGLPKTLETLTVNEPHSQASFIESAADNFFIHFRTPGQQYSQTKHRRTDFIAVKSTCADSGRQPNPSHTKAAGRPAIGPIGFVEQLDG